MGSILQEVAGLQPATSYRFRLLAINRENQVATNEAGGARLPEGLFETAPPPAVAAQTGAASEVTTTSATVSGSVNPDGQPSTYTFEMGVDNGSGTRFAVVFSGAAGAGATPVEETVGLTGLQPGTIYAYRIAIHYGDGAGSGASATGGALTFTTGGLPAALSVPTPLAQLAVPVIAFPFPNTRASSTPKKLTRAQQLAHALAGCAKQKAGRRAACRRSARRKYAAAKGPATGRKR